MIFKIYYEGSVVIGYPYAKKLYFHSYFAAYSKVNSKWTIDLTWRPKTIKLLRENTEKNLCDLGLSNDYIFAHKSMLH